MRVSLDHAHIFASDAAATVDFFQTMFGGTVVWDDVLAGVRGIRLQIGRAFIMVYDQPPKAPRGGTDPTPTFRGSTRTRCFLEDGRSPCGAKRGRRFEQPPACTSQETGQRLSYAPILGRDENRPGGD